MISFNRPSKYRAVKSGDFPSKLEAAVHQILLLRQKAGEITDIKRQVRVELTKAAIATKVDFSFIDVKTGTVTFCEAKGVKTERYRLIERLWRFYGPSPLEVYGGNYRNPKLMEVIVPNG
jgi:hypothetical protein